MAEYGRETASTGKDWRELGVASLPYMTLQRISSVLDMPALDNWKSIFAMMPQYGLVEQQALAREELAGRSPTLAMLQLMESHGKTVGDLFSFAAAAQLKLVCDYIVEGLKELGFSVNSERACSKGSATSQTPSSPQPSSPSAKDSRFQPLNSVGVEEIPYSVVADATGDFSDEEWGEGGHKVGKGGFGQVYCCQLKLAGRERVVAVKVLSKKSGEDESSWKPFEAELQVLAHLDHPALLPLLGCSCDGPRPCLLYPYMSLRSLDLHLSSPLMATRDRVSVAKEVTSALSYLHTGCDSVLVHRDVKSANVLLEDGWKAKLADFGVVRSLGVDSTTANTGTVVGTLVYMAPEYLMGVISPAADVYALGVILLELLFGCSAAEGPPGAQTDLISFLEESQDPSEFYFSCWSVEEGGKILAMAEQCTEQNRKKRPATRQVLDTLTELLDALPPLQS